MPATSSRLARTVRCPAFASCSFPNSVGARVAGGKLDKFPLRGSFPAHSVKVECRYPWKPGASEKLRLDGLAELPYPPAADEPSPPRSAFQNTFLLRDVSKVSQDDRQKHPSIAANPRLTVPRRRQISA